jgi:tripartite-type tricarboxylate transporter receptor subunit TctC
MSEITGQQWIVENKGGSGGNVGMDALAQSPADGYTLGLGGIASHAISPTLYAKLPFNARTDFTFVSTIWELPNLLVVNLDLPAKSVPELIELLRKNPGKYSYGSAGSGTTLHLSGELFKIMAKVDILGVPYKTQPQVIADLLGGRIDVTFSDFTTGLPPVKAGQARGLGVTSLERYPGLEQYPAVAEFVPGYESRPWNAVYAPAGTPRPIVDKLNALIREAMKSESYRNLMKTTLGVPFPCSPDELAAWQAKETIKWGEIVRTAGMQEP